MVKFGVGGSGDVVLLCCCMGNGIPSTIMKLQELLESM